MLYKIITALAFLFLASSVQAANLYFDAPNTNIKTGSFFEATIVLDSQEESINAIDGNIYFPTDFLEFVNIRESNSIINFWVEKPSLTANNTINFSGIIPGGYSGQGNLFKIIFKTKKVGQNNLDNQDVRVFLNDGLGTESRVSKQSLSFTISDDAPIKNDVVIIDLSDQYPPEPFTPIITKIPEIAGDKYLLIFITQDKDSGVDYYQVKEGLRPYVKAESPYLLQNQKLDKKITVRAVDKSGNVRTVTISPVYPKPWYENFLFFAIIIVVIIVLFSFGRSAWKKQKTKSK